MREHNGTWQFVGGGNADREAMREAWRREAHEKRYGPADVRVVVCFVEVGGGGSGGRGGCT